MIVYFADRKFNIIAKASTRLPKGLTIVDDSKVEEVETGVAVFECAIAFNEETRKTVESCVEPGNYILRSYNDENEFYTIIESEFDTKNQEVLIYAEDAGLDLLNEIVGEYEADKAYGIDHYIQKFAYDSGFVIGINEVSNLTRKLAWDGEATITERIASIATQFDGAEVSYSFDVKGLSVVKKYINIYKKRGKDIGTTMRLNKDIDRIVTKKSITNLATALLCTGGTPEDAENPINLSGYTYDDGDFFTDGRWLKSRKALEQWNRYTLGNGWIVKPFNYDTTSQATLCAHAITELKKAREMEVNYEVDITKLPPNTQIGDRVNIVDEKGELYISARVLKLETSAVNQIHEATIGEYLIKEGGISQKVADLAEQFAKSAVSATRALSIANKATTAATEAKKQADVALANAGKAQQAATEATTVANTATQAAQTAQQKANDAQAAVDVVEESVTGLQTTIANAQKAAEQAHQAAQTAEEKATEAQQAVVNAQSKADEAAIAAGSALDKADSAEAQAQAAQGSAEQAIANAEAAATTAAAAKLDAENAQKEIDSLGDSLTTLSNTMSADYARKTDLTETSASLQTQITQNAAGIRSTASKVQEIDETANDAHKLLLGALSFAEKAQEEATKAQADAEAAQVLADEAAQAAEAAQNEADTAKTAANTARSVADEAETALEVAREDLATVQSRADATEEEIEEAQKAVEDARQAAKTAKANSIVASGKAAEAQAKADAAVLQANVAQETANTAASKAALAQNVANEAKGNAEAAQAAATQAVKQAAEAQATAQTAVENAEAAQELANNAAKQAATATQAVNDAQAKVDQAYADLATAQQKLANVLDNVDATEEEVIAAQEAVNAAQTAADMAQEEAETAQAVANEAAENADTAQAAADTAQAAADTAQATAREAQKAAYQAQSEVYGLAVRVENAETQITQNASQIALAATRKAVSKTLGGYSTTQEMQAAINVKADGITSSVADAKATADNALINVSNAESIIKQLADSISALVRDGSGGSLIRQDANGLWYFDISNLEQSISNTADGLNDLEGIVLDANGEIDVLKSTAAALQSRTEYVRSYTDENGQPCLELGEGDSVFKVRITNTEIQFVEGTSVPAKLNRKMLVIEKAMVKDELQFGDDEIVDGVWIWKRRENGNLGLSWKEVVS